MARLFPAEKSMLFLKGLGAAFLACLVWLASATHVDRTRLELTSCPLVHDRNGRLMQFIPDEDGLRHVKVDLDEIDRSVQEAFIAAEDERFYSHPGFDVAAIVRALRSNLSEGRVVSGASTITQQLASLAYPQPRTYRGKILEIIRAFRIELMMDKEEILDLYLNRVPLGNNLRGVEAASRTYFGRSSSELSIEQAAVLASLPKAPGRLNPYGRNRDLLLERARWVIDRMALCGFIPEDGGGNALADIGFEPKTFPLEAPHFVDLVREDLLPGVNRSTIDLDLQNTTEEILRSHRPRLQYKGATQAAAIILDNRDLSLLAMAGSMEYSDRDLGYNNGAVALRSPGSALKPFLYALALDQGYTASMILDDVERKYRSPAGQYSPVNFNRRTYGPVSMREALASSLNLSAVHMLNLIGPDSFYDTLDLLGLINFPERGPDHYGLGMVVGNPEVTMVQLAQAYAVFANGGEYSKVRFFMNTPPSVPVKIFSSGASFIISDILQDTAARTITFGHSLNTEFPYGIGIKTGTSTLYRDCWIAGYTRTHTVVVWAGNFSGQPTWGLSGATAAAPILGDIFRKLYPMGPPESHPVPDRLLTAFTCTHSGMKAMPHCPAVKKEYYIQGTVPDEECTFHSGGGFEHRIPPRYAQWLYQRYEDGEQGRYRLEGFDSDLDAVFTRSRGINRSWIRRNADDHSSEEYHTPVRSSYMEVPVSITYPLEGDNFIMDRFSGEQEIILKAVAGDPLPFIKWFVDGEEIATAQPPYETAWKLSRGSHQIAAVTPNGTGDSIELFVE